MAPNDDYDDHDDHYTASNVSVDSPIDITNDLPVDSTTTTTRHRATTARQRKRVATVIKAREVVATAQPRSVPDLGKGLDNFTDVEFNADYCKQLRSHTTYYLKDAQCMNEGYLPYMNPTIYECTHAQFPNEKYASNMKPTIHECMRAQSPNENLADMLYDDLCVKLVGGAGAAVSADGSKVSSASSSSNSLEDTLNNNFGNSFSEELIVDTKEIAYTAVPAVGCNCSSIHGTAGGDYIVKENGIACSVVPAVACTCSFVPPPSVLLTRNPRGMA